MQAIRGDELLWCEGRTERSRGGDVKDLPKKRPPKHSEATNEKKSKILKHSP
jgi:hypothetical protein